MPKAGKTVMKNTWNKGNGSNRNNGNAKMLESCLCERLRYRR
jgi:hypothetical protein